MDPGIMRWIGPLFPALFIGLFEFARHEFLNVVSMNSGNLLVAALTGIIFFVYFHGILSWLQSLNAKLQKEKEESAVLKERDRIARELHDSIAQALFFMNIKAIEIDNALERGCQPLTAIKELREAIQFTDTDIRQHIFNLHKISQDNVDLLSGIQEIIRNFQEQSEIPVEFEFKGDSNSGLDNQKKAHLLRILQEVLCNIRKHAEADRVQVCLIESSNRHALTIKDNGCGFDMEQPKNKSSSFGLKILEERSRTIGADFSLKSWPGLGTTVSVILHSN